MICHVDGCINNNVTESCALICRKLQRKFVVSLLKITNCNLAKHCFQCIHWITTYFEIQMHTNDIQTHKDYDGIFYKIHIKIMFTLNRIL